MKRQISIKWKLLLVIIPLQMATTVVITFFASVSARNGITRVAIDALAFKALELNKYAQNQWDILEKNGFTNDEDFVGAAELAIASYANTLLQNDTEVIYAFEVSENETTVAFSTYPDSSLSEEVLNDLGLKYTEENVGWQEIMLEGKRRTAQVFKFMPLNWLIVVSEEYNTFYADAQEITTQAGIITMISLSAMLILSLIFIEYTIRPLRNTVAAMLSIIRNNDLSTKIEVQENDEFGQMAHTFNVMTEELDKAYSQIKNYALNAVIAKRNESKVRNIFQKYVPSNVIDSIFENPEKMLIGENRDLSVMFTDIRSFTTISESLPPEELVTSLNSYYGTMVDIIMAEEGIIDKYIGDAIMAIFGAPNHLENSPKNAITAALNMQEALEKFNTHQKQSKAPQFITGMGIVYGKVTVGNIGSEKKMDYTVIGDTVNLGARLESLTKLYGTPLLFSDSVFERIKDIYPCRMVDIVQVKGKTQGERIYTTQKSIDKETEEVWKHYHSGLTHYYQQEFSETIKNLKKAKTIAPDDILIDIFLTRAEKYLVTPPRKSWNGIEKMRTK